MTASTTAAPGRCRMIAALERDQASDVDVLERLMKDVAEAGAAGVKLAARTAEGATDCADDLSRFIEHAGDLDVVVAPYDLAAVRHVAPLRFRAWKLDPPMLTHLPLLDAVAADGRPILAGVAGCTVRELQEAVCRLPADAVLLHTLVLAGGNIEVSDVAHMTALRQYARPVGYADRSLDMAPALVAVALGAAVVEKPLTLDRLRHELDHRTTLLPHEFRAFVARVRCLEQVLGGDGARDPLPEELDAIEQDRVSIVASRAIPRGTAIQRDMLTFRAPGIGLSPRFLPVVEGHRASYDIPEGAVVTFGVIES